MTAYIFVDCSDDSPTDVPTHSGASHAVCLCVYCIVSSLMMYGAHWSMSLAR